jgi:hypothetical protein
MDYNAKIYALILQRIEFINQGLPPLISDDDIIYASNLVKAYEFVGITTEQSVVIENELNRITNNIVPYPSYTQDLFSGFFNLTA